MTRIRSVRLRPFGACWPAARACFAVLGAASSGGGGQRVELLRAGCPGLLCFAVLGAAGSGGGGGVSCCCPGLLCRAGGCGLLHLCFTTQITMPLGLTIALDALSHNSSPPVPTAATPPLLRPATHTHTPQTRYCCAEFPPFVRSSNHPSVADTRAVGVVHSTVTVTVT